MSLTIRRLGETFVGEVRGVDLRQLYDGSTIQEIYQAWLEHGVLVIPGQALDIEQHLKFARTFGELWTLPEFAQRSRVGNAQIDDVSNLTETGDIAGNEDDRTLFQRANRLWHSDSSSSPIPAKASLLHAVEIATEDGETEFADVRGAYDALPDSRKSQLEGLIGQFSFYYSRAKSGYSGERSKFVDPSAIAEHPLVRVHPETGRKGLFIGEGMVGIRGMAAAQAESLIAELNAFATSPRFVYRHRWAVFDMVIWDNRRTLHRARPYDASKFRRVMHRATTNGEEETMLNGKIAVPKIEVRGPFLQADF